MTKLTWLSHGSWLIETGSHRILLDPFLTDNPAATQQADQLDQISHILVSHGHFDHVGDVASIANRCGAAVIAIFEVAQWFSTNHNIEETVGMNIGGQTSMPWGEVKMTPALHSSQLPDGSYAGNPAGFLLSIEGKRLYFACDTAFFSDMKFYASSVDLAVLPIGDLFTMGIEDSLQAIKTIEPKRVLPAHYNTWPPIEQDAAKWADRVREETNAEPLVLQVGETIEV